MRQTYNYLLVCMYLACRLLFRKKGKLMSNTLTVRLSNRKTPEGEYYEATIDICGARPTKLVRRNDNTTRFPTRSSAQGAVRHFAKTYNFTSVNIIEPQAATAQTTKKAAKKSTSASKPSTTSNKTASKPTSSTKATSTTTTAQRTR